MTISDIDLVYLAKAAQDDAAFAELVRRHQAGLRAFLRKFTMDAAHADDLAQDTLIKAYRGLAGFAGGASFRSWLYAIAWREFLQDARRNKASRQLAEAFAGETERADSLQSSGSDLSLDLRRALARLEDAERAALLLCDAAGMSHAEAATALGAPLGTVKTYVARARARMRAALAIETPVASEDEALQVNGAPHVR